MDKLPSRNMSLPLLLAAPLAMLILSVLTAASEGAYLFVLDFINNVAGKPDLMVMSGLPSSSSPIPERDVYILQSYGVSANPQQMMMEKLGSHFWTPLVGIEQVKNWGDKQPLIKGTSPRWIIPLGDDRILVALDPEKEKTLGLSDMIFPKKGCLVSPDLWAKEHPSIIKIKFELARALSGRNLLEKYHSMGSNDEKSSISVKEQITEMLKFAFTTINLPFNQSSAEETADSILNQKVQTSLEVLGVAQTDGVYPSSLRNVILVDMDTLAVLFEQLLNELIKSDTRNLLINYFKDHIQNIEIGGFKIPVANLTNAGTFPDMVLPVMLRDGAKRLVQGYSMVSVVALKHRTELYHPSQPLKNELASTLQSLPTNYELRCFYPFYRDSLGIKYFFDSIIQVFTLVTILLYFYIMMMIVKQVYEEKQI